MRAAIVANGEMTAHARLQAIWRRADVRIAADGGARNARLVLEIAPHVVIGDMDSLDDETHAWLEAGRCEFIRYPSAKDETDLELALHLAQTRGAEEITILGAFGGRADHFLANVLLLTQQKGTRLVSASIEMWLGSGLDVIHGKKGDIVSLIPLDARVEGITTEHLEYPLHDETLERGSTRGISNVMLGERAQVISTHGTLLIAHLFGK